MKVGIIGIGAVGSACALATVVRGCAREIVLVNRARERARGAATDMQYGAPLSPAVDLYDGDYPDLAGAELVMICAGVNEKSGGATDRSDPAGRLKLLDANVEVYEDIVPEIAKVVPDAVILVVTDPPDPLADFVRESGFKRVLSSGTYLDSLRFRVHLAKHIGVDPRSVEAQVLGEHGTSQVLMWSSARVAGVPVLDVLQRWGASAPEIRQRIEGEVRYANITIIEGIGASQYGIGMVAARIAEIVLRDERAVIPIGSYSSRYGVTLSLPSIVGREGVMRVLEPEATDGERQALEESVDTLRDAVSRMRGNCRGA